MKSELRFMRKGAPSFKYGCSTEIQAQFSIEKNKESIYKSVPIHGRHLVFLPI